jgi:penicillin-binding protein 1A
VNEGTGTRARVAGYDIAGKTGTTSDYRDAWFVGYTGGFVTAVWVGKDNNKPMKSITGGNVPAGIWHDFMSAALPRLAARPIPGDQVPGATNPISDAIGDLLSGIGIGPRQEPTPETPQPEPPPQALPY